MAVLFVLLGFSCVYTRISWFYVICLIPRGEAIAIQLQVGLPEGFFQYVLYFVRSGLSDLENHENHTHRTLREMSADGGTCSSIAKRKRMSAFHIKAIPKYMNGYKNSFESHYHVTMPLPFVPVGCFLHGWLDSGG